MFPITYLVKAFRFSFFFTLTSLIIISCKKEELPVTKNEPLTKKEDTLKTYSPAVSFEITRRMLEGKYINCIEPDYKGNTWIASGKELYYKNDNVEKTYTLDFPILYMLHKAWAQSWFICLLCKYFHSSYPRQKNL